MARKWWLIMKVKIKRWIICKIISNCYSRLSDIYQFGGKLYWLSEKIKGKYNSWIKIINKLKI